MISDTISKIVIFLAIYGLSDIGVIHRQISALPIYQTNGTYRRPVANDTYPTVNQTKPSLFDEIVDVVAWFIDRPVRIQTAARNLINKTENNLNSTVNMSNDNTTIFNETTSNEIDYSTNEINYHHNLSDYDSQDISKANISEAKTFSTILGEVTNKSKSDITAASSESQLLSNSQSNLSYPNNNEAAATNKMLVITRHPQEGNQTVNMDMEFIETSSDNENNEHHDGTLQPNSITTVIAVIAITDKRENLSAPATISTTNTSTFLFKPNGSDNSSSSDGQTFITTLITGVYSNVNNTNNDKQMTNGNEKDKFWLHTRNTVLRVLSENNITYEENEKMSSQTSDNKTDDIMEKTIHWNYPSRTVAATVGAAAATAYNESTNIKETTENSDIINNQELDDNNSLESINYESVNITETINRTSIDTTINSTTNEMVPSTTQLSSIDLPTTTIWNELVTSTFRSTLKSIILNNFANFSILLHWKNTIKYVPSDAVIKYYPEIIKITWRRDETSTINNTIILMLKEEKYYYAITEIVINLETDDSCITTKIPVNINPQTTPLEKIKINSATWMQISNVNFLWKTKDAISDASKLLPKPRNRWHYEVTIPILIGLLITLLVSYNLIKTMHRNEDIHSPSWDSV